ncbi:MAG: mycofactocin system GMC family oxidoreductase MftG [Chloroflexi bacterium]|jgi:choline dehydrogenase|nr:mycofactocin system GMC family oxidoreductase MftG [Chloroflexota bacterium]MBT5626662.1 mycofactocin system GMC family oxidoreductase MftG [Chloroflexota bacterium]
MANSKYDVIVIGAGSAGAALATRLSEDASRTVLLIEAGPDYANFDELPDEIRQGHATGTDMAVDPSGVHNWAFTGKATPLNTEMPVPRGKITGGTSAINGQVYLRAIPEDFDMWVADGNDEWSYDKSLPFMNKLENDLDITNQYHGNDGPIVIRRYQPDELVDDQAAFINAVTDAGYARTDDHNHPASSGVGPLPLNNPDGIRWSTALGYLTMARDRSNFTLSADSHTTRVLIENKKAVGIEFEKNGKLQQAYAEEVVLSAGPIGSPHLLMLSGLGRKEQLEAAGVEVIADMRGVGQNLRDHPSVAVRWHAEDDFPMPDVETGPQKTALRYTAKDSELRNDMIAVMRWNSPLREFMMSAGLYLAKAAGEIRLVSNDSHQQPELDYHLLDHPYDLERMRAGVRMQIELGKHSAYKGILKEVKDPLPEDLESDETLDKWLLSRAQTMHHISCTARMGAADDPMAVTNQYGQVHGIEGLRIADLSIMPDCPRANTNSPAMMIGERIADFMSR